MQCQVCIIIAPCLHSTSLKVLKLRWKSTLWELRPWWKKMVWWRLKSWQIWSSSGGATAWFFFWEDWCFTVQGFMVASGHLQVHKMLYIGCDAVRCVIFFRFGFYLWNCVKHQEISIFGDLSKPWKCNKQVKGQCHFISPENEESPHHLTFWVPQLVSCWSWKRFIPNHLGYYMLIVQFCYRYVFVGYLLTFFNVQSSPVKKMCTLDIEVMTPWMKRVELKGVCKQSQRESKLPYRMIPEVKSSSVKYQMILHALRRDMHCGTTTLDTDIHVDTSYCIGTAATNINLASRPQLYQRLLMPNSCRTAFTPDAFYTKSFLQQTAPDILWTPLFSPGMCFFPRNIILS